MNDICQIKTEKHTQLVDIFLRVNKKAIPNLVRGNS